MKTLYLHIGLHKTGTSAIQKALSLNSKRLLEYGFLYPDTGKFEAHHDLASRLRSGNTSNDFIRDFFKNSFNVSNDVIVSSEIFSELSDLSQLGILNSIFERIFLVVYLRRQDHLIESAYGQIVKQNGESRGISEVKPYFTDLYKHLNKFKKELPNANFLLRNYDKKYLDEGDSGKDFFINVLGLKPEEFEWSKAEVNKSLGCIGLELLRRLNFNGIKNREVLVDELIQTSSLLGGKYTKSITGGLLTASQRKKLIEDCSVSNTMLKSEYGFDIESFFREEAFEENQEVKVFEVLELAIALLSQKYK